MTTDAWQLARERITRLWRGAQPARAADVAAELDASYEDARIAHTAGDQETLDELRAQWRGRFRRLLVAHPEAAGELRALLDEFAPAEATPAPPTVQRATASGHARVYQAGRDQHISER